MATQDQIRRLMDREYKTYEQISSLKSSIRHHRFHTYRQRRNLMERLARAERLSKSLIAQLLRDGVAAPYSLYQRQQPHRRSGLNVIVELSLDGTAYSNPAPVVPNGVKVWVRVAIEESHTGELGIPRTHEMYHISWAFSSVYVPIDGVPAAGRDHYVVSNPLIIIREFRSPSSGTTKKNFFAYIDVYNPVG